MVAGQVQRPLPERATASHHGATLPALGASSPLRRAPMLASTGHPRSFDGRQRRRESKMDDQTVRAALQRHWDASDASDFEVEHQIYREDAVLDYPQSGERIHGRRNIQESRTVQPNKKRFTISRMVGGGDLWITEFVLNYDGVPS
jgi:hypothetical protein